MITQERLKELLFYHPKTGLFVWRVRKSAQAKIGSIAGSPSNGYICIKIDGKLYYAHLLAWLYVYGEYIKRLDHKDRDSLNNRIENLRKATHSQNLANTKLARNSTSGFKGVRLAKGKWKARIQVNGKRTEFGTFNSPKEAHEAYKRAALEGFGEFANPAKAN